jgi:hypothetical protein
MKSEPVLNLHSRLRHIHEDYDKGIGGLGKRLRAINRLR